MIIERKGHKTCIELTIEDALDLQEQLARQIGNCMKYKMGVFERAAPTIEVGENGAPDKTMPGVISFSVVESL